MATAPTPIDAVLFDYGMVLSGPPNAAAWARMRSITSLDEEGLQRGYWEHRHPYDRGTHTGGTYWRLVGESSGLTLTPDQIAGLIDADTDLWTDLNPPMLAWAQELQQADIRTGILSNLGDSMAAGIFRKFNWIGGFDHCTWSHELKLAKPEAGIYHHAAQGLQTVPERILFIDDRLDNLEGARAVGMQVIQYSSHAQFLDEMQVRGFAALLAPLTPSSHSSAALRM